MRILYLIFSAGDLEICINLSLTTSSLWVCLGLLSISWYDWSVLYLLADCMPVFFAQRFGKVRMPKNSKLGSKSGAWVQPECPLLNSPLEGSDREIKKDYPAGRASWSSTGQYKSKLLLKDFYRKYYSFSLNGSSIILSNIEIATVSVRWRCCKNKLQTNLGVTHRRCAKQFLHLSYLFRCR